MADFILCFFPWFSMFIVIIVIIMVFVFILSLKTPAFFCSDGSRDRISNLLVSMHVSFFTGIGTIILYGLVFVIY